MNELEYTLYLITINLLISFAGVIMWVNESLWYTLVGVIMIVMANLIISFIRNSKQRGKQE